MLNNGVNQVECAPSAEEYTFVGNPCVDAAEEAGAEDPESFAEELGVARVDLVARTLTRGGRSAADGACQKVGDVIQPTLVSHQSQ